MANRPHCKTPDRRGWIMKRVLRSPLSSYGLALAVSILALVLTQLLSPLMERNLFLLFLAAVAISTWYGGLGPGLLATLFATLTSGYLLLPSLSSHLLGVQDIQRLVIFVLVAVIVTALGAARRWSEEKRIRLAAIVESSEDAIIGKTLKGIITSWNEGAERIYGYSADEVRGRSISLLAPPDRRDEFPRFLERIQRGEPVSHFETVRVRKDGEPIDISLSVSPVKDASGKIVGASAIARDITERKRAEAVRRKSAELFQQRLEQRVSDRTRELSTLYAVTAVASGTFDLKVILYHSLDRILEALGTHTGFIHLLDDTGKALRMTAERGIPQDIVARTDAMPVGIGGSGWVMAHGEPLVVPDTTADSRTAELGKVMGPRAYVCVPIRAKGCVIGVLSVLHELNRPVSDEEVALLVSIGDQLGVSVDHARLLGEAQDRATREERERLARELHDSVTQALYSLTLLAEAARRAAGRDDAAQVEAYLTRLGEIAHQSLKEMRLLVYQLRPAALEKEGLVGALQQRLDAVEKRAGVEARLLVERTVDMPANVEEDLFRIAQEALNNSLKHASATCVTVRLQTNATGIEFEVADDGKGFDPESVQAKGGMGLTSMSERAARLGATLSIRSAPGSGTRVIAKFERGGDSRNSS
jgi:PAS domain S-box-containing protein